jgi:outer membrane protein OmpA-like peptidoglycan-associated protein
MRHDSLTYGEMTMSKARLSAALLATAMMVLPAVSIAQPATITEDQALCTAAPELPSCASSATNQDAAGESVEVGSDQKVMRLVALTSGSSSRSAAPAARPAYVAPAPNRGAPRLVAPSRQANVVAPKNSQRMQLAPTPTASDMVVTFRSGKADLTPQALSNLRVYARALKNPVIGDRRYVVEGHTDAVGSAAANRALSQKRAESVVAALVAEGVPSARLEARGYGSEKLRLPGRPSDGANRRVELVKGK